MSQTAKGLSPQNEDILTGSSLFSSLSKLEFDAVAACLEYRYITKDHLVFSEGEMGKELFILLSGELSAYVTQSGEIQRWMFNITPGNFFGEMSIIANEPRSATITAKVDSELMVLRDTDFYHFISRYPMIGVKLLKAIGDVQNTWLEQTARHLNDLVRWGETARKRAITDDLTGLYNRRFLEGLIKNRFEQGIVQVRNITLLMMDLDKVHAINETYGTQAGDQVIIATADTILQYLRNGDVAARFSGDEFAVLLQDTNEYEALGVAERIRDAVFSREIPVAQSPGSSETTVISAQVSIGVATAPTHAGDAESLMLKADDALLKAKRLGRNRVEIVESDSPDKTGAD
ncbi:MAG: GGDEF domain-containing protein [Spirochaetaceae bacterium]|jgi:diguanylate cyclase (GGDEF)-like protein|nr:GGDEF domain-containing protein [Spirochaetaceae bacterium]